MNIHDVLKERKIRILLRTAAWEAKANLYEVDMIMTSLKDRIRNAYISMTDLS